MHIIIPALNEESAIATVLGGLPPALLPCVIVVDNGSTDRTADVARDCGVRVVREGRRGYGSACLAGIASLSACGDDEIVLFMDGDASDEPADVQRLIDVLRNDEADLVIGARAAALAQAGARPGHAVVGTEFASALASILTGVRMSDLGPLRAIRLGHLRRLGMRDRNYGWTMEMQMRAVKAGLRYKEIAVHYRPRIGQSKISGTLRGSVGAGLKIILTALRHAI